MKTKASALKEPTYSVLRLTCPRACLCGRPIKQIVHTANRTHGDALEIARNWADYEVTIKLD